MKMQGLFLVAIFFNLAYTQLVNGQISPGCKRRCGNITIEFPFGTQDCYYAQDESFKLTCDETEKLIFGRNIEVTNISSNGELRVKFNTTSNCYNNQGEVSNGNYYNITLGNLSFSTSNRFTLVGCNAFSLLTTFGNQDFATGCISVCVSLPPPTTKCNGQGCCSTDVFLPLDKFIFTASASRFLNKTSVQSFNPCIHAFLVEDGKFNFSSTEDLMNLRNVTSFPVVLDWSIGTQTCEQVGKRICGGNSTCFNSTRRTGYNCQCLKGYEGNPYLSNEYGCLDIDECTSPMHKHNCTDSSSICENTMGHFACNCRSGFNLVANNTCIPKEKPKSYKWTQILLGTTISLLVILLTISCIQQRMKHQKNIKLRQQFFEPGSPDALLDPNSEIKAQDDESE